MKLFIGFRLFKQFIIENKQQQTPMN